MSWRHHDGTGGRILAVPCHGDGRADDRTDGRDRGLMGGGVERKAGLVNWSVNNV